MSILGQVVSVALILGAVVVIVLIIDVIRRRRSNVEEWEEGWHSVLDSDGPPFPEPTCRECGSQVIGVAGGGLLDDGCAWGLEVAVTVKGPNADVSRLVCADNPDHDTGWQLTDHNALIETTCV